MDKPSSSYWSYIVVCIGGGGLFDFYFFREKDFLIIGLKFNEYLVSSEIK